MGFESVAKKRMQEAGYVEGSNKIKSEPKQTQTTNSNKNNTAASTPLGQLVENSKYTPQARVKQLLSNPQPQPTKTETKVKQIFLKPTNSAAAATPLGQEYAKSLTNLENMMKTQTPKAEKNKSGDVVKYFGEVIYETFKNSAKSIGNGILDIISMQQNQSKYDPVLLAAESTGLVKSGYGEAYGNIVDKQTKTITENIKKSAINQAKKMENIQNKYSPLLSKGVLKAGEYASGVGQIMATQMIPYVGTTLLALQVYGGGVQEGLLDGTDIHSARMLGGAEAIKEVAISKLFGGIPLTKGIADDIINSIGSKLFTNKFSKGLYKMAINGIGEGLEEDFSAILTPYIKRAIYDKNAPTVTFDELKDNFMGGFVPSLILGGGANVLSAKTYLDLNNKIDAYNELVVKTDSKDKLKLLDKKTTTLDEYNDAIKDLFVTSEKSKIDAEKTATQAEINWLKKEIDGVTGLKLTNEEKNTIVAELTKKIAADENYLLDLNEQKNYIAQVEKGKAELRLPAEEIPYNELNPTHIDIAKGIENPKGYVNVREVDGNRFVVTNAFGEEVIKTQDELNTRYISKESDPIVKKMIDTVITAATSTPKASSSDAKGFFVGDVYTNNKTGQSYKVIESNDTETIMENEKGERRRFANNIISSMAKSGLYTKTFAGDETIEKTDTGESGVGDIITDSFTLSPVTRADNNKQVWVLSPNKSLSADEISTVFKKSKAKYVESLVTADGDAVDGYVFNKKPSLETIDAMNKLLGTTEKAISTTEKAIPTTEKSSATVEKSKTTSKTFPKISLNERLVETVRNTIAPNVLADSRVVDALKNKFGENYIDVLAQDILATYERDGDIGEHEALFSDGGQAIYNLVEGIDEETSVDADEETKTEEKPVKTTKKETAEEAEKSTKTKKISEEKTIENELEKDNESFASDTKKPLQKESSSDTMEEKIIDKIEKRKADSNEERRNDLLHDNSRRGNDGDTGKQARQIQGFERKNQGKDATERRKFGRELIKSGQVEKVNDGKHEYTLVKPEAYNEDMQSMVDEAKKNGRELSFFIGTATVTKDDGSTFQADGIRFGGTNRIAVQYDGDKVPQKIAKHETIHSTWVTPKVQKIAKKILTSLSEADRQKIAELNRYEYYKEIFEEEIANGEVDIVWEEFVCDVMSGMNDYTVNYIDDVNTYWYGNKEALGYDAASYATSTDAGGDKYSFSSLGFAFFGNEDITSEEFEKMVSDGSYKKQKGYRDYVKSLVNVYKQSRGIKGMLSGSEVRKIEKQIEGILKVAIASKKAGYDIYDDGKARNIKDSKNRLLFSSLEPNSDYFTSNDLATICDKARNFTDIYDAIIKAEEGRNVPEDKRFFNNVDNYFTLHKIMADKGLTIPCDECYVQSMRKNLFPMAKAFIELVTETNPNNKENKQLYHQDGKDAGNIKKNNAKVRDKVISAFNKSEIKGKDTDLQKLSNMKEDALTELGYAIHEELNSDGSIRTVDDLTIETLTTAEGLAQLKLQAPKVYEAFNSFYGQSKPKMPREASPFRPGELIALLTKVDKKTNTVSINTNLINKIKSTGGFRLQSYSDFQIKNFVDVLQTIFEAGMLGLNGHAYTKVPAFLDATDGTNLKRNISIFMKEKNGNWVIDKKNSFPMELEDIYALVESDESGNTSIIAVSQNADMSAWIMANDNVGYGIPFHKSGTQMDIVRSREGYENMIDHTNQQSEVYKTDEGSKKRANNKVSKAIDIYKFWDFKNKDNLSQKKLIEKNLKRYIDECEKRNYRPKFRSYLMDNGELLSDVLNYAKELGFVPRNATVEDIAFKYGEYTIPYGYYKFLGDFGMFKPDGSASSIETLSLEDYDFDKAIDFFKDSSKLRQNELLQQLENGKVREEYRKMLNKGELTIEQLDNIIKQKRSEVVEDVVGNRYSVAEEETATTKLSEGSETNGSEKRNIDRGTGRVLERNRNKGRRNTSNQRDFSDGQTEMEDKTVDNISNGKGSNTERSNEFYVDGSTQGSAGEKTSGRKEADGRRFLEAVKNGDETTARALLDKKAMQEGFTPSTRYHGTNSDEVFTEFKNDGRAHWVSTDLSYAEGYTDGYFGNDKKAEQLFTSKESGVYDLYVKTDDVLDVGNIEKEIQTTDDILDFAKQIGFSKEEIMRCWNSGRVYESNEIWTITITPEFAEIARSHGYDSLKAIEKNGIETFGILYPENIKSAKIVTFDKNGEIIPLEKRFDTSKTDFRYSIAEESYAPTFYSKMGKVIDEMKQDKIAAKDVVRYLTDPKRGVKAEEIKWSGIEEFLDGKKSVTKAELQEFVASNQLEIEETVLSEEEASNFKYDYTDFERSQLNALEENLEESWGEIDSAWQEMFGEEIAWDIRYNDNATRMVKQELNKRVGDNKDSRYEQIVSSLKDVELWESQRDQIVAKAKERTKEVVSPKWSEYKLEGGDNYREITFKMPGSDYSNQAMRTHWGEDAKGILAHARVQDFDVDGKKMLFIEEIQSDWHNEGNQKGYIGKNDADILTRRKELESYIKSRLGKENSAEEIAKLQEARREYIRLGENMSNADAAPDAPFRNNYHEYALKRLIRMAAEEGYDSIGWTPADVQSKRWSDEYAEGYRIEYDQDIPKFLNKYGKKWGAKVGKTEIGKEDGGWYEVEGTEVWSMPITDSMKNSVLYEGQTRYSLAGENTEFWDEFLKDYIDRNSSALIKANPINDTTIYDFMGETERLKKENAKFKEEIERLKERVKLEKKLTHGKVLDERLVDKAAVHLRKMANSTISKADLTKSLNDIYSYILNEPELTWDDIYNMCYGLAEVILDKSKPEVIVDDYYKQILKDIRNTRISLSDSQKNEARDVFDKNWNKYFFGDVIIANDGVDLESKWQEWSGQYPGIFEPDISDGEMISELYNTIQTLKEASETVVEYNEEERARWLANEIYNDYWNVSPIKTTADKYYDKIKQLASDHKTAMAELRESFDVKIKEQRLVDDIYYGKKLASLRTTSKEKLKDLKATEREKFEKIYNDIRERKNKEIAIAKEEGKKRLATYKDTARKQALVKRITSNSLALNEKLIKNSKDKHIPEILKDSVRNLLNAIDFSSKRLLEKGMPTKKDMSLTKALGKVKDMMMKASNGYEGLTELYGHGLDEKLEELIKSADEIANAVGDNEYVLNKLSADKLETLDKMVKTISKAVNQLNKFHSVNYSKSVEEFSKETISYLDSMAKAKLFDGIKGKAQKLLEWDNALPYYVFKRYGSGGKKIYEALQDGWDKFAFNVRDILDYSNKAYSEKEIKQWSKEVREFDIKLPTDEKDSSAKTQKVQMTIPQIMSMYCLNKREQARNHMYQGGIRIADIKTEKGKVISQTDGVILTPKDVLTIVSSLSDRQKEVADTLQDFMNTVCSDWGNEVTMKRFGYKAFGEKNYFPIQSDKNNLAVNDETEQINSLFRLLNMSFTKSLDENANNRIVISDIFDVFANHTSDMAKYNALALPVLDSFKWYNYKDKENISKDTFAISSVKQSIESAFGKEGQKYFTTFLTDINGAQDVSRDTFGKGFFSNAKIAAVGANMRVVALQPTSYPRASAVLDNKYLSLALAKKPQPKMAEKYCGIALWKSLGYYDTNIQRGVQSQIKHDNTVKDKIVEISMKGAEIADKVTWGYLWTACELETKDKRKDLALDSEEFYHATAKRLREVIYATQVVDSTMTRSQMMRSTDGFDKLITAFASEPTLSYNMLQDAYMGYKLDARKIGKAKAWKNNRAKIAKTSIAYVTTSALAALVESAFDKLRDDDDEDKLLRQYFLNLYSNLSIIGKIPYAKEIQSVIKGFSVSRTDAQWMEELVKGIKAWYKMFNGKGNPTSAIKYLVKGVSDLTGYPIYNIYRDTMAVLNKADVLTFDELNDIMKGSFMYGMIESEEESVGFGDIKNSQPEKYKAVSEKLKNLEEKTGVNLQPTEQQGYYTVDGVKYEMTEAQLKEAQEIRGEKSFELITDLFNDKKVFEDQKKYSMLNDEDKVKYIKRCYREAGEYTKEQMIEKVKASSKEKSN